MKVPYAAWQNVSFESCINQEGSYILHKTMKDALEEAYIAGFNTCRDQWGGMNYKETLEWHKVLFGEMLK
jgi:hypothetical protein